MLSETRPAKVGTVDRPRPPRSPGAVSPPGQEGEVIETPEEMCWRVAQSIAAGEARYGRSPAAVREVATAFYDMMVDGYFVPNSPTLMNAGKGNGLQYSACYVLPVGDSMEEIFDSVKAAAIIHKSGGGTGFAFSRLRPKDDIVASTGGRASGPVSFLRVFNSATEAVKQGGTRRGANMGILRVDHPDVLEFIDCKLDGGITNFNISVAVTDAFMDALAKGEDYDLINPHSGEVDAAAQRPRGLRAHRARGLAHRRPGHGLHRPDQRRARPTRRPSSGRSRRPTRAASSRCCPTRRATSARSTSRSSPGRTTAGEWSVDWDEMERVIRLAVRFLDDVIEMNPYPLPRDRRDGEVQPSHRPRHHGLGRPALHPGHPVRQPGGHRSGRPADGVREGERRTTSAASWPRSAGRSRTGTTRSIATCGRCATPR